MPNLLTRDDTLLGVCEGLGEEFGVRPDSLRVLLGALLLWNPPVVIGGYLGAGAVLAASRWLMPVRRPTGEPAPAGESDAAGFARAA